MLLQKQKMPTYKRLRTSIREHSILYEELSSLINSIKQGVALIIGAYFNIKTKLQVLEMEKRLVAGKYAKNKVN